MMKNAAKLQHLYLIAEATPLKVCAMPLWRTCLTAGRVIADIEPKA